MKKLSYQSHMTVGLIFPAFCITNGNCLPHIVLDCVLIHVLLLKLPLIYVERLEITLHYLSERMNSFHGCINFVCLFRDSKMSSHCNSDLICVAAQDNMENKMQGFCPDLWLGCPYFSVRL